MRIVLTVKTLIARNNAEGVGFVTTPPTVAGNLPKGWMSASSIAEAEFISVCRPRERCRFSGLSRTTLIELLDRGAVQGVTIRRPGATRGKRLIVKKSLADYLYGLAQQAAPKAAAPAPVTQHNVNIPSSGTPGIETKTEGAT